MTYRATEITQTFTRWLERFTPPKQIKDNPRACQDEADALLKVLLRFAPSEGYRDFLAEVFDRVEIRMETRAWPSKAEIGAACSNVRKECHVASDEPKRRGHLEINADRMNRGDAVAETYVFGPDADTLLFRNMVPMPTMQRYRDSHFAALCDVYGRESAVGMMEAMRRRPGEPIAVSG